MFLLLYRAHIYFRALGKLLLEAKHISAVVSKMTAINTIMMMTEIYFLISYYD